MLNFIQTLTGSFYSPETYRNAVNLNKGKTFAYLLFLVLVCTIPLMISIVIGLNSFLNDDGRYIVKQLPEITIRNGNVSMDAESPYYIKSKAGEALIVIDLSDSANTNELQGSAKVLLTKNKLIAQQKENEIRTYDLSKVSELTLNSTKIFSWFEYAWILYCIIFVGLIIILFIYRLIQALFNALLGLIISSILKINLDYTSLLYITMVAITPVAILASVIWATDIQVPAKGWLGFILALGYISFGIMANKPQTLEEKQSAENQDSTFPS